MPERHPDRTARPHPSPSSWSSSSRTARSIIAPSASATDAAHERLIELLVSARLVTSDDGVVVLAHEALARAWPRLRGWLDEDVEGQRIFHHVTVAADNWEAMGRPDSELYRGVRLAQVLDWRQRARPDLSATERAFLDAGQALADTERLTAEDRARHQVRINRRLRGLLAGVALLLVVAGVAAVRQRDRAQESAADAEVSAVVSEARRIGTQALTVDDLDQSLLLSVEGRRLHVSNDTRASRDPATGAVVVDPATSAVILDPATGTVTATVPGAHAQGAVSPDGSTLVAGLGAGLNALPGDRLGVFDLATGELRRELTGHSDTIIGLAFSPDGRSGRAETPTAVVLDDGHRAEPFRRGVRQ